MIEKQVIGIQIEFDHVIDESDANLIGLDIESNISLPEGVAIKSIKTVSRPRG